MVSTIDLLSTENAVFCCFLFWASVLVIKMLFMSLFTALQRFRFKSFLNEDANNTAIEVNDPHVERVRRAHLNDMENILPFFTMALIYIATDPNPSVARNLFRVVGVARIAHTLVYAFYPVPQPARGIAFFTAFIITVYMAGAVLVEMIKFI